MPEHRHEAVKPSVGERVRGQARTRRVESFWALLKHAVVVTFYHVGGRHLARYVVEFAARPNLPPLDTIDAMRAIALATEGRRLPLSQLGAKEGQTPAVPGRPLPLRPRVGAASHARNAGI